MKTPVTVFALAAGLLVLAGCSTPTSRIKDNPAVFAQLTAEQQQLIKEGKIAIGFDSEMVQLALGKPDRVRERTDVNGASEIWSYVTHVSDYDLYPYAGGYYRSAYRYGMGPYYYPYTPYYPAYFPAYATWQERENFRVVFQNDHVVMIEQEK